MAAKWTPHCLEFLRLHKRDCIEVEQVIPRLTVQERDHEKHPIRHRMVV
jgi:hypothetical protein